MMATKQRTKTIEFKDNEKVTCKKSVHIATWNIRSIFSKKMKLVEEMKMHDVLIY